MTLEDIISDVESRDKTLTVLNQDEPEPIVRMLERMVDAPDVTVQETEPPENTPGNLVILEDADSGDTELAISSIAEVGNSVLMVNSDLYVTGTRSIEEVDTPDVIAGLDNTFVSVSGKQKMLLIEISRHVEALAYRSEGSTLHSGFQNLSRIEDERGTKSVYEKLVAADASVHVYGTPSGSLDIPDEIAVHADDGDEIKHSWFVVNTNCADDLKGALIATEIGRNEWTGIWTFDPDVVDRVAAYLTETYGD